MRSSSCCFLEQGRKRRKQVISFFKIKKQRRATKRSLDLLVAFFHAMGVLRRLGYE